MCKKKILNGAFRVRENNALCVPLAEYLYLVTPTGEKVICLTNGYYFSERLYSNSSLIMSKCGTIKKVAHEAQPRVSPTFLTSDDVFCDVLLYKTMTI